MRIRLFPTPARLLGSVLGGGLLYASLHAAQAADTVAAGDALTFAKVCTGCHNLELAMDTPRSYEAWHDTVQDMAERGAKGTDDQFDAVMDYLHRTMTTINVNTADAEELEIVLDVPPDVARAIVARRATAALTSIAELKSIPGISAKSLDAKARLIFFK